MTILRPIGKLLSVKVASQKHDIMCRRKDSESMLVKFLECYLSKNILNQHTFFIIGRQDVAFFHQFLETFSIDSSRKG